MHLKITNRSSNIWIHWELSLRRGVDFKIKEINVVIINMCNLILHLEVIAFSWKNPCKIIHTLIYIYIFLSKTKIVAVRYAVSNYVNKISYFEFWSWVSWPLKLDSDILGVEWTHSMKTNICVSKFIFYVKVLNWNILIVFLLKNSWFFFRIVHARSIYLWH